MFGDCYRTIMKIKFFAKVFTLLSCFAGYLCITFRIGNQRNKQTILDRFDNTCGLRNLTIIFKYTSIINEGKYLVMNCSMTVKEDLPTDLNFIIRLERCKNKENLDTCEHFYDYKSEKFCTIISMDSALWGPIFSAFNPKFECPLQKGVYKAINSTVDASAFLLFPSDSWYWRAKVELTDKVTNKMHLCLKAEARVITG